MKINEMKKTLWLIGLLLVVSSLCRADPANPYYTGDGGKGISIAILAPKANGLTENQGYIPALVQGELVSNFSGYSAMDVLDRENLDSQYAELFSGYYRDDADSGLDLGHLTPTAYIMGGSITRTATGYALQIQITKTADKITAASYSGTCTFAELDNLSGIRRASLELLEKMGVKPTERTRTELGRAAAENQVKKQTALSQGIAAQQRGTVVEALSYYYEAARFDSGLGEAANRVSALSANISSGNLGQNVRNRVERGRSWLALSNEAKAFYTKHLPYEFIYDTALQVGKTDIYAGTTELSAEVRLVPSDAWKIINDLRTGLRKADSKNEWGISIQIDQQPITVVISIINENGKTLATASQRFRANSETNQERYIMLFRDIKVDDITDRLTVQVISINGISAQNAGETGYIQLATLSEYNSRLAAWKEIFKHTSIIPPVFFELGYIYAPDYPLGFRIGTHGFYTTMNFGLSNWDNYSKGYNYYDKNGNHSLWPQESWKDLGSRTDSKFEWIVGFSVNVIDNLLVIPIGIGGRHIIEYRLFSLVRNAAPTITEWVASEAGWQSDLMIEVGLEINLFKGIALLGTYRLIDFQESSYTLGICLIVPRRFN